MEPFIAKLTTMSVDLELMGKFAAEQMIERITNRQSGIQVIKIKQRLIDRGSCKKYVN
jgi:DNA-binding LacI/PurR family transcriptional regulator